MRMGMCTMICRASAAPRPDGALSPRKAAFLAGAAGRFCLRVGETSMRWNIEASRSRAVVGGGSRRGASFKIRARRAVRKASSAAARAGAHAAACLCRRARDGIRAETSALIAHLAQGGPAVASARFRQGEGSSAARRAGGAGCRFTAATVAAGASTAATTACLRARTGRRQARVA